MPITVVCSKCSARQACRVARGLAGCAAPYPDATRSSTCRTDTGRGSTTRRAKRLLAPPTWTTHDNRPPRRGRRRGRSPHDPNARDGRRRAANERRSIPSRPSPRCCRSSSVSLSSARSAFPSIGSSARGRCSRSRKPAPPKRGGWRTLPSQRDSRRSSQGSRYVRDWAKVSGRCKRAALRVRLHRRMRCRDRRPRPPGDPLSQDRRSRTEFRTMTCGSAKASKEAHRERSAT